MYAKIAAIVLVACLLVLAGCVNQTQSYNPGGTANATSNVTANPDLPPPFPEENAGGPANPDMPPPLPE